MVSAINPLGTVYSVSVSDIGDKSAGLTKAIANNVNPDISTFHSIFSRQLNAAALRGTHIVENLGIGYNLASTALSTLNSLSEQLDTIRNTIMALDNASAQLLDIEQENYTSQIGRIFDTLVNTDFNGKRLFDGTLANAPVPRLPSQNLPDNAGSLLIETSISSQSYVNITIPRLLSGDGTIVNAPVDGVFDPLFPVTDNAIAALTKLSAVANIGFGGNFAGQKVLIDAAIPSGVNAEQDIIRKLALDRYDLLNDGALADTAANAQLALLAAKAVGGSATLSSNNREDIIAAINNVTNIMAAAALGLANNAAAIAVIVAIPSDATVSYAQKLVKAVALVAARRELIINPAGDNQASGANLLQAADAAITVNPGTFTKEMLDRSFPNPIYIGSIKTLSGRAGSMKIIDNAIRSINTAAAQITGQRDVIETNTDVLKQNIISLIKSADSISNADYEKIIPKLTEFLRSVTVLSVAFGLEEEFIETIINRLEFIGNQ